MEGLGRGVVGGVEGRRGGLVERGGRAGEGGRGGSVEQRPWRRCEGKKNWKLVVVGGGWEEVEGGKSRVGEEEEGGGREGSGVGRRLICCVPLLAFSPALHF